MSVCAALAFIPSALAVCGAVYLFAHDNGNGGWLLLVAVMLAGAASSAVKGGA